MDIELRHLRSFIAVAQELHFGRAAQRLHVAQPPLSQQIRRLEDTLGVALFDRSTRPIRLTAAGDAFLEEAQLSLRHAERAVHRSRRAAGGEIGRLGIGATFWALSAIVPAVLRGFRARVAEVSLELTTAAPTALVDDLKKERLDLGFVAFAEWSGGGRTLQAEPLLEEPMMAIVPEGHPFAQRASIGLEELADEPFVMLAHAIVPGLVDQQMAAFHARGVAPADVHETTDPWALLSLIAAGVGVGLHMASFSRVSHPGVVFVALAGDAPTATLLLLWRREEDRELVRTFVSVAREVAAAVDRGSPTARVPEVQRRLDDR